MFEHQLVLVLFCRVKDTNRGEIIGIANTLCAVTLFLPCSSNDHIFLALLKYSVKKFSLFILPLYPTDSSCPKYFYVSPSDNSFKFISLIVNFLPSDLIFHFSTHPIPLQTSPWAYNRILDICHFLNFKTGPVYNPWAYNIFPPITHDVYMTVWSPFIGES